ncbi:MAG: TolC family protein [Desulfobacteraceae bacterium]|nr:TolC family protein [Desulfobacteraceae bacterium]
MNFKSLITTAIFFLVAGAAPTTHGQGTLSIGMVFDTPFAPQAFVRGVEKETRALLSARTAVEIADRNLLRTSGEAREIRQAYQRLVKDNTVDIIIGAGMLTANTLGHENTYPKPLILLGVWDKAIQGIPYREPGVSGKRNLAYLQDNIPLGAAITRFQSLVRFKTLGIAAGEKLLTSEPDISRLKTYMEKQKIPFRLIPVTPGMERFDIDKTGVDAVLLGGLYRIDEPTITRLIAEINRLALPSFAIKDRKSVDQGVLAAMVPVNLETKVMRRIALMIEKITNRIDPAELPVALSFDESFIINMATANAIGFQPGWDAMSEAELINFQPFASDKVIDLRSAMETALSNNLALASAQDTAAIAKEDVRLAQSTFRPTLEARFRNTRINDERAVAGQAANTSMATGGISQTLFSEPGFAQITAKKHLETASTEELRQEELDTLLSVAGAYFNILMAKTNMGIKKEALTLTKKNLEIAHVRNRVGYAGMADVFRWESKLATTESDAIEAYAGVLKAKNSLRRLLNLSPGTEFDVKETTLDSDFFSTYGDMDITRLIDGHNSFEKLIGFMTSRARRNHPELKQLDASFAANKRLLSSLKRKQLLPTVALTGEWNETLDTGGTGSDFTPEPEDSNWSVSLNASWALYSGGTDGINTRIKLLEISRLDKQRRDLVNTLDTGIIDAALDLLTRSEKLALSRQAAEAAGKSLDISQDEYRKGKTSVVELLDAQNAAINADLAAANAVYDYLMSIMTLERKNGRFISLASPHEQQQLMEEIETFFKTNQEVR